MATILVNARAGLRGVMASERLDSRARAAGFGGELRTLEPAALCVEVDRLRREGCLTIGVAGGDGTLSTAADRLAGSRTALLPIPTGTLNHFARRLGFTQVGDAFAALENPRIETVPVGVVDDRIFLNTATFGLYADVVRRRERLRRFVGKLPAAALAFVATIVRQRRLDLVIQIEGEYLRRSTMLVWVGLGWGSFPRVHESPERRSSPDLEIVILRPGSRLGSVALFLRLVRHLLRGHRPISDPALEVIHARSLLIHAPYRIGTTLDGETQRCDPPLFVAVDDDALRVVRPNPV